MKKTNIVMPIIFVVIISLFFQIPSYAKGNSINTTIDNATGKVKVSGSIDNAKSQVLFITVLKPNAENGISDLYDDMDEMEFLELVYNIAQVKLDTNNTFTFEFTMQGNADEGWYTVAVTGKGVGLQNKFYYVNEQKIRNTVRKLNTVSHNDFVDLLSDIGIVLKTSPSDTKHVYDNFVAIRSRQGDFETEGNIDEMIEAVRDVVEEAEAYALIYLAKDTDVVKVIKDYNKYFNIDLEGDFKKAESKIGGAFVYIRDKLSIQITSKEEFEKVYHQSIALTMLNTVNRTEVHDVLVKYNHIFKLDLNGNYSKVDALEVAKSLAFADFKTVSEVTDAFNTAVSQLYSKQKQSNSSSGGSGGKGSSGKSKGGSMISVNNGTEVSTVHSQTSNPSEENIFEDLDSVEWAKESIHAFAKKGIVRGVDGRNFEPNRNVLREEFVKIMVMAMELPLEENMMSRPFEDVDNNKWYYKYILTSNKFGIVNGVSENEFGVGRSLTREDLAVICYRAAKAAGINFADSQNASMFSDDKTIADYAKEAVYALTGAGVINGVGNNEFSPKSVATRAQAVKIMYEIMNYSK